MKASSEYLTLHYLKELNEFIITHHKISGPVKFVTGTRAIEELIRLRTENVIATNLPIKLYKEYRVMDLS